MPRTTRVLRVLGAILLVLVLSLGLAACKKDKSGKRGVYLPTHAVTVVVS